MGKSRKIRDFRFELLINQEICHFDLCFPIYKKERESKSCNLETFCNHKCKCFDPVEL